MDDSIVDQVTRVLVKAYDPEYGGFGSQPKFPAAAGHELLLHIYQSTGDRWYLEAVERSLDNMMNGGIYDGEEGGFFRYSTGRDWSAPHYEKMLEDNVVVFRLYTRAYLVTGNDDYARVAAKIAGYLDGQLRDGTTGAFYGGQDADEEYYALPLSRRREQRSPGVDPVHYTGMNAALASAYLEAGWVLNKPELAGTGLAALDYILTRRRGLPLRHSYSADGGEGVPALLPDYARLLLAVLDAHVHTSNSRYLEEAGRLAGEMVENMWDREGGGFFDILEDPHAMGNHAVRQVPITDNATAAEALMRLHSFAPAGDYRTRAEETLNAFVDVYQDYGEAAAGYALAVQRFLYQPIEVTVVGQPGSSETRAMLCAAATVPYQHVVVQFASAGDQERLSELGYFAGDETQAYVCLETLCLAPVTDPADLHSTISEFLQSRTGGVDSIFQLLGDSGLTLPN